MIDAAMLRKFLVVGLLLVMLAGLSAGCTPAEKEPSPQIEFKDHSHRIAAGWGHSLAATEDGHVVAWRASWDGNRYGQVDVPEGLANVAAVAAGETFSLALKANGEIVSWGGIAEPTETSGFTAIAAGRRHALALRQDGTVYAWGANNLGQLDVPTDLEDVVNIATGNNHSLAVTASGKLVAWGENTTGQCDVPELKEEIIQAAGGWGHSMALGKSGTVYVWGNDTMGQTRVPESIQGKVRAVFSGWWASFALLNDGSVRTWGGYTGLARPPQLVPEDLEFSMGLAAGELHFLSINADGSLRTWSYSLGGTRSSITGTVPTGLAVFGEPKYKTLGPPLTEPKALSFPYSQFNLVLRADGTLVGWGEAHSQIATPLMENLSGVVDVTGNTRHYMALLNDGTVVSLNEPVRNTFTGRGILTGPLPSEGEFVFPHVPAKLPKAVAVAVSYVGAIAITEVGNLVEWSFVGRYRPAGNIDPPGLSEVSGLKDIVEIAAGDYHYLALRKDGTLFAWGDNEYGQATIPPGGDKYRGIAAWADVSVAIRLDGTLVMWGNDRFSDLPEPRPDLTDVVVAVPWYALTSNGDVVALRQPEGSPAVVTDAIAISTNFAILSDGSVVGFGPNAPDIPPGLKVK